MWMGCFKGLDLEKLKENMSKDPEKLKELDKYVSSEWVRKNILNQPKDEKLYHGSSFDDYIAEDCDEEEQREFEKLKRKLENGQG